MDNVSILENLLKKYERKCNRSEVKEKQYEEKEEKLSKYGFWSMGYYGGYNMACDEILEDLKELCGKENR